MLKFPVKKKGVRGGRLHIGDTNKRMLVGVYLDKGRVSDTPESAETVISETYRDTL